jgi:hypothetical protein
MPAHNHFDYMLCWLNLKGRASGHLNWLETTDRIPSGDAFDDTPT